MLEKIENSFRDLIASLQVAKLYTTQHPRFNKFADKAYESLQEILEEKEELVLGIIGEELAFEKEIFFDLSKSARLVILYFKEKGIERIAFYRGLQKEELCKFIAFLATPKDQLKTDAQNYLALQGVKNIAVGKIKVPSLSMDTGPESEMGIGHLSLYENSLDNASQTLKDVLDAESIDYLNLRFTLHGIMEDLLIRYQELLRLTTMKRYSRGTFTHSFNVSVLSMYLTSKLLFNKEDVLDIGMAALFHDTGKLYISRRIINKPTQLTEEEFSKMRSHTVLGAEILLRHAHTLGILPVVVAFEHHLRYNLKGYPKLAFPRKPHVASMIVSICDVYDALCQRRNYKNDYPPNMIYDLMMRDKNTFFDPQLLDKFFQIMGVWPIGTIVSLSDKRIAVVRGENEDDIRSPKVEIIYPKGEKEIINLKDRKESLKVEYALNPWKEGKDYLSLI